ncbi:Janus/Ocnus family protein [Cooperia oncophora]
MPLSDIPDVDIDPSGTFKYILIKCTDKSSMETKHIVRGYYKCHFHVDILRAAREDAGPSYSLKCIGGGRIRHEDDAKEILVYGYSHGFGQADHSITVDILKKRYPDYHITFSNEGY